VTAAADTKNYDGTTASDTLPTITSGAVQPPDAASFSESYSDANAGSSKMLIPSGIVSDGDSGNNYNYTFVSSTNGTINPLVVSIASGVAANDKVYDGTTNATLTASNVVLSGVLSGDGANVSLSLNGYAASFVSAGPGSNISVTVTGLGLVGSAAGNYTLTPPAGLTANIFPLQTPTIIGITMASGGAQITFSGQSGQTYRVLATSDLTLSLDQWTVLTTGSFGSAPIVYTDNSIPAYRFYVIASP
jgi:hypothetical protein